MRWIALCAVFVIGCGSASASSVGTPDAGSHAVDGAPQASFESSWFSHLSSNDCKGIASGDKSYCDSNDCKGIASGDKSYCDSNDCKGVASKDKSYCDSNSCKAWASGV